MGIFKLTHAARRECAIAVTIFIGSACWGMVYVSTWGGTADILQASYGPSVMVACGRGFVNPKVSELPELAAFLQPSLGFDRPPTVDRFRCDDLPADVPVVPISGIHKQTWHMFMAVGWVWRVFGVAWSALTPLYGLLYGLCAVAAYALFRLLLGSPIAVFCTVLFLVSPLQLHYLTRLRDFAKAPFMLFALFCLLLLLVYPKGWKRAIWTGAAAGAAIGTASGFRPEALMYLVLFVPAVVLFYPGWNRAAWGYRAGASVAFALFMFAAAAPALLRVQTHGERAHPFLMGYGAFFDERLGATSPVYKVAHTDLDTEAVAIINAHNQFLDAAAPPVIYEVPGYDVAGDDYFFRNILWKFPGDLATRTAASALRIFDELRPSPAAYMPRGITNRFLEPVYAARAWLMETLFSRTRYVALALMLLLGALSPRLGLLMLYTLFCLAGMASVQFASRHYFHLEVIPIFVGGALLHLAWRACCLVRKAERARFSEGVLNAVWFKARLKSGAVFGLVGVALVLLPLWVLRWHQDRQFHTLFSDYEHAETVAVWPTVASVEGEDNARVRLACDPVTLPDGLPEADSKGFFQVDMLVIELARANHEIPLLIRYSGDTTERDLSWHTVVAPAEPPPFATPPTPEVTMSPEVRGEMVRYYVPIYNAVWPDTPDTEAWGDLPATWTRFEGIEMNAADLSQLKGIRRFRYAGGYTPLIHVVLADGWEKTGLHQRFTR